MEDRLPTDLSALGREGVEKAKAVRDGRLASLFRRWPAVSKLELAELRRLHDERLRLARHSGARRRALLTAQAGPGLGPTGKVDEGNG
jgi:hypothetical protein